MPVVKLSWDDFSTWNVCPLEYLDPRSSMHGYITTVDIDDETWAKYEAACKAYGEAFRAVHELGKPVVLTDEERVKAAAAFDETALRHGHDTDGEG